MGGRCAVAAAVAVWSGMLLARALDPRVALAVALPFALLAWRAPPRVGTLLVLVVLMLAGAARGGAHCARLERARAALPDSGALVRLEGTIVAPPQDATGAAAVVLAVGSSEPPLPHGARVRLWFPAGVAAGWSDRVRAYAWLAPPGRRRNPGGRDPRAAADASAIAATGRAYTASVAPARGLAGWPRATAVRWRRALARRLDARLDPAARDLLVPLVLGDRTALPSGLGADLRAAGLVHLLALSGLHVAWMVGVARAAAAAAGGGVAARAIAGALCALGYVGIAGPLPSLMRAAATEWLRAAAQAGGRALDPLQALGVSALGLLVVAPGWAGDLGFQLSCAATLGLVTLTPRIAATLARPAGFAAGRTAVTVVRRVGALVAVTTGAQLGALPLLLDRMHAVSWVSPLSNLVAVPLAGLLLCGAMLALGLDLLAPGLGTLWFHACDALAAALAAATSFAARAPSALLATGSEGATAALAAFGVALAAIACAGPHDLEAQARPTAAARSIAGLLGAWALATALVLAISVQPIAPPPGCTWIVALDVGQGDAIALGREGRWWMVDAGPSGPGIDAGQQVALPFLRWAGVRSLQGVALTHDDRDHTGGAPALFRSYPRAPRFTHAPQPHVPGPAARFGATGHARGDTLDSAMGAIILWPPRPDDPDAAVADAGDNQAGLVLRLGEGAGRALLMADADTTVEVALDPAPGVALLKVAHHGSRTSSGRAFLSRARPGIALISCGRRNPFGHPAPDVLARLKAAGCAVRRTDQEGALWFALDSKGIREVAWRQGSGAFRHAPATLPAAAAPRSR